MNEPITAECITVGVLGGMGPEATVDFMSHVIALTPAETDQQHVPMLVDHNPRVPDRQRAMRDGGAAVRAALTVMACRLEAAGAGFLVMPCNTAHAFVSDAAAAVSVPFVGIIDATVAAIREEHPSVGALGLLATDACLESGLYQEALGGAGLRAVLPDAGAQRELMQAIYRIKAGDTGPAIRAGVEGLAGRLAAAGAEAVIAGCTEIPLVLGADAAGLPVISSTEVLARRTVEYATGARTLPRMTRRPAGAPT